MTAQPWAGENQKGERVSRIRFNISRESIAEMIHEHDNLTSPITQNSIVDGFLSILGSALLTWGKDGTELEVSITPVKQALAVRKATDSDLPKGRRVP